MHLLMSYCKCVGTLRADTGIVKILSVALGKGYSKCSENASGRDNGVLSSRTSLYKHASTSENTRWYTIKSKTVNLYNSLNKICAYNAEVYLSRVGGRLGTSP